MTLTELNALDEREVMELFRRCCGSRRWVQEMAAARPFATVDQLFRRAEEIWQRLSEDDWKEAFAHHPKIGDFQSLRQKFAQTASWSENEQAAVRSASEEIVRRLAQGNRLYEQKFGHIFIVCASGKSAEEMLMLLEQRLHHSPEEEIVVAANEQARITRLRLEKVLSNTES
ncbi:MAG TPA: 2-oxo-4-hydroxy-4-carboxy-5-ureidoimidazoline decarboxylase [Bacteroidota bacterium]|nr:2-oxo-4-hydroxy-4-carboxy-5-ureidoimidazoline decarboxylase [Bacteroidota bacterium]